MKRNLDLLRHILIAVEERREAFGSDELVLHGFDGAEILYHVGLLIEAGYLTGVVHKPLSGQDSYTITGLTFAGHDYLDAVRSARIWQSVKDVARQTGVTLTVGIARDLALRLVRQAVGV